MHLSLYQPDIPQNVGAAIRLCACLGLELDIIEPTGFPWDERKIRQSALDYINALTLNRYSSWEKFKDVHTGQRIILLSTKAALPYTEFSFRNDDILLAGRESAGVPDDVHNASDARVFIPMRPGLRSLNVITACAMVAGEAL
ncbi:MAG: tRNA (cytidine(34)-2'-O)-methyltransferase, partial [Alphaproteobacteria bacterium]|nr:tRNA (cytidine(34)-2'-O)-methyltransferase [Alphaproteobacteria bacterium]